MGGWHSPLQPFPELLQKYIPFPNLMGRVGTWLILTCRAIIHTSIQIMIGVVYYVEST